jgi:hypothetical protein
MRMEAGVLKLWQAQGSRLFPRWSRCFSTYQMKIRSACRRIGVGSMSLMKYRYFSLCDFLDRDLTTLPTIPLRSASRMPIEGAK